ncbi:hypothetical protein LX64_02085 [Chitinophaga skermanii]|uniref:Uncharacterized protein n=1 Tax=Chitinophaga skermanii TaxID=331697 RepID=A0A327QZ60_9BACT|nr:hypothetical protein [Chitinophaga skermanii]RAJ06957.1 hypothetical protein LX64_02085 [Chitinophaga skermanii]
MRWFVYILNILLVAYILFQAAHRQSEKEILIVLCYYGLLIAANVVLSGLLKLFRQPVCTAFSRSGIYLMVGVLPMVLAYKLISMS